MNQIFARIAGILATLPFLKTEENPVSKNATKLNVVYVLLQYSLFPKNIVSMLTLAKRMAEGRGWTAVAVELDRNIGQELGSESNGTPHYLLLAQSVQREFGLNIWATIPNLATDAFIRAVWAELNHPNPFCVLGATYALESTAVPELRVVFDLVRHLATDQGREILQPETQDFFRRHLNTWEPSHEKELRAVIDPLITSEEDASNLACGFCKVTTLMAEWWKQLAIEAEEK